MTRLTLIALFAAALAGPWSGCERDPVTPPATPPTERAPGNEPADAPNGDGTVLVPSTRELARISHSQAADRTFSGISSLTTLASDENGALHAEGAVFCR
jgi:hypothetical protein